jgi:hypothetical protein
VLAERESNVTAVARAEQQDGKKDGELLHQANTSFLDSG